MSAPLFTLPSASKEDLQNACAFIQSECSCNRRPYDSLSVVCGGLRPLYSGAPIEAEIIASIISLLSPPAPHDGSWHRRPSSRYVPAAQEVLFKCGGLDVLVACLGYPSALNKPAIAKCIALAVGLQPGYISRAVHLGVLSSLSDVLSNILKSGIFHNNCASFAMAIEALMDSNSALQNEADAAGFCVLLVNSILSLIGGNGHEVVHHFFWAITAMSRSNDRVISSFARAGAPGACVRGLASCPKLLIAEAALDVLILFMVPLQTSNDFCPGMHSSLHDMSASGELSHAKLAVSALLTSDQAVARLTALFKAASRHGRANSIRNALIVMLSAATLDFGATASVLERSSSKSISGDTSHPAVASSSGALVQSCISSLKNNHFPQLCSQLIAKLSPISNFACNLMNDGGIKVLLACMRSNLSPSSLKCILSSLAIIANHHQDQFVSNFESIAWYEISTAVVALLQRMKELREKKRQQAILTDSVRLLQILSSLPISFHFRMNSLMLTSMAIEIVLCCVISSHICSDPEMRGSILIALQFVLNLMEFDLSIKPNCDLKTAHDKMSSNTTGGFILDVGEYQSATSLVDVAPLIPDLLNLMATSIHAIMATSNSGKGDEKVPEDSTSITDSSNEHRAILLCILKVLSFLVDNPLAADVAGAAGGIELLVKLYLFGEEDHKATVITVLRVLHTHNDMNRQILARLIGKLPHATKSVGKLLLKEQQPWLRSPSKVGLVNQSSVLSPQEVTTFPTITPDAYKSLTSNVHSHSQNGFTRSDSQKRRLKLICHQPLRASSTAPSHLQNTPILPHLLAPLSKIFESYSSSDRMSAKNLRKFCHDFSLKESHSRAIMLSHADISSAYGDDLPLNKFVEAISVACRSLHLSLNQFLCEIGAKNARAVSIVVDAARERSVISQRLEQTKRAICVNVDEWKDRQFAKMRLTQQHIRCASQTAHEASAQKFSDGKDSKLNFLSHNDDEQKPPRNRGVMLEPKREHRTRQPTLPRHQLHRPRDDEAALWAEFGCFYNK